MAKAVGGATIHLGGGSANRLNPLDPGPRDSSLPDDQWPAIVEFRFAAGRHERYAPW